MARFLQSRLNHDGLFNIDWGLSSLFLSLLNLASPPVTDQLTFEINRIDR